jgi:archaellum component FlaF (FlaF/FlaG flagellin family)
VKDKLAGHNPEYIGKGEDKFEDNIVMVKRTMEEFSVDNIVIVDGTSLEETVALGEKPILLSGRLVPQETYDFMKREVRANTLVSVMLIGNELVVPIYDMRERMEQEFENEGLNKTFGIIVKFAQVVPSAGTGVLVLDEFPLPSYKPVLVIKDIAYNNQNKRVMVSVDNAGEGPAYFTQEIRVLVDGADYDVFGTEDAKLIERGEQLGTEYELDLSGVPEGNVTAVVIVKFGSSKKNLEEFISSTGPLTTISFTDESDVGVQSARYSPEKSTVMVTIRNNGDDDAYVFSKLKLIVGGAEATISSADVRAMDAGSLIVEEFPLELTEEDLKANKNVSVLIDYGAREGFLLKKAEYIVPLEEEAGLNILLFVVIGGVLLLAVLAAIAYIMLGRKKPLKKKKA